MRQRGTPGARHGADRGRGRGRVESLRIHEPPHGALARPDPRVKETEDALQAASALPTSNFGTLTLKEDFPHRPGFGTVGASVVLWTNHVEIVPAMDLVLYRYDLSVTPSTTGKRLMRVIKLLLDTPLLAAQRDNLVTDFKSTLLCRELLWADRAVIEVQYLAENEDEPRQTDTAYQIQLLYTNTLAVSELMGYLTSTSTNASFDDTPQLVQAFNIFMNHFARSHGDQATVGSSRNFSLNPGASKRSLGAGLTAIRGFFSSVRIATCRVLVNVNVTHSVFYEAGALDEVMTGFSKVHSNGKPSLDRFLHKVRVKTTHLPERKNRSGVVIERPKTILGLVTAHDGSDLVHPPIIEGFGASSMEVQFWLEEGTATSAKSGKAGGKSNTERVQGSNGRYISIYDFFRTRHGRKLRRPELPVVNTGSKERPSYLPAEVCIVLPGQTFRSKLDPAHTQSMIQFAVRKPWENARSIVEEGLPAVGLDVQTNVLLTHFGISVKPGLITVPGRILEPPKVIYSQNKAVVPRYGSWNMNAVNFNRSAMLQKWSYLLVSVSDVTDAFEQDSLVRTMDGFHQLLHRLGVNASPPLKGRRLPLADPEDPKLEQTMQQAASSLHLLFVILPSANTPLYNRIKLYGDVIYGIHTICSVGQKLAKEMGRDQYLANIALKFNLKLGGVNQVVDSPGLSLVRDDKTMLVGVDVTHPSPGSAENAPSIAGMVANLDRWLSQWPAILRTQKSRQEMVADLTDMLKSRLTLWRTKGKHVNYPDNIVVYRDGVSEGQYDQVVGEELPLLRRACKELYPPQDQKKGLPHFAVIIVGKRHHTRFYPTVEREADRSSNTRPGTVVDRGVTQARNWDFFLQPHAAIQGTARPAHYYVLVDEVFRRNCRTLPMPQQNVANVLEDLTHSLCYMFGRATKAVSICPPAYYADIVCERARCYMSRVFSPPFAGAAPSSGTSASEAQTRVGNDDVRIHPRLRDTMFYI